MYILVGAKGDSLGNKVYGMLKNSHPDKDIIAVDRIDFDARHESQVDDYFRDQYYLQNQIDGVVDFVGIMRTGTLEIEESYHLEETFRTNAVSLFNIAKALF